MNRVTAEQLVSEVANIGVFILGYRDKNYILGRWAAGAAVGELDFEGLPGFVAPKNADEQTRKDYKAASVLVGLKPRFAFDEWLAARQELADFLKEEHRLELRDYQGEALRDALQGLGLRTINALELSAKKVYSFHQEALAAFEKYSAPQPASAGETETQSAAFDLAIASKFAAMPTHEKATFLALLARPDAAVDLRTLEALYRVPAALSGLSADDLANIRAATLMKNWPQVASGVNVIAQCVGPAHDAIGTAITVVSGRAGVTLDQETAPIQWVMADYQHVLGNGAPTTLS
jgi:hypothetical protein